MLSSPHLMGKKLFYGAITCNTELEFISSLLINHETYLISFKHMWLVSLHMNSFCTQSEAVIFSTWSS